MQHLKNPWVKINIANFKITCCTFRGKVLSSRHPTDSLSTSTWQQLLMSETYWSWKVALTMNLLQKSHLWMIIKRYVMFMQFLFWNQNVSWWGSSSTRNRRVVADLPVCNCPDTNFYHDHYNFYLYHYQYHDMHALVSVM